MGFGSAGEMIFLFVLALVVLGPRKLPELARQLGRFMNEFKRASNEFKYQIESEINNLEVQEKRAKQQALPPPVPSEQTIAPPPVPPSLAGTVASGALSASSESAPVAMAPAAASSEFAAQEVPAKGSDA
jgi:sec-independent protein translocase protein TatB